MRRIPFSRKQKVVDKLEELEELDVIEKVNGPTSWINPLVSVEKPNGDVRICLDMRQANRAILREKHPVPTIEETLQEISGAKVFSKLDLNMAFHQVELAPESRDITTFAGPNGLYRYKRLIFGVNMATEKFQHIIWQILKDCPGAHNIHDDIRVVGASEEEHDERLNQVMKKLEESGLTLNYEKCQIGVSSMEYLGNVLTDEGLQVSGDKVEAIVQAPRPKDRSELRSFLGLAQCCSRFIPSFTIIASPLWDLTKSHAKWKWGTAEEKAFQAVKMQLTQAPVMVFFKQGAETRVTTDASPVGIRAVLEQKQADGLYRPVHYASRKLTPPESRYSQFEREALAVKWGCEKFFLYIHGNEFEICTDHKPLVTVFGPHSKPPSARIERWLLYMQQFKFSIRHIPGRENAADALSRLPVDSTPDAAIKKTEEYARSIVADAIPAALAPRQVERESERDPTLQLVRHAITSGDWSKLQGTTYKAVRDELWIMGQLVMRGNKVVIPEKLWNQTIQLAHEGHQGMVRTKSRLREKVWWPDLDKQVEKLIRACYPCQLVGPRPKPEPIRSKPLPQGPWSEIAVDLLEIQKRGHLLVVVDYYSKWPEIAFLTKTDAGNVIKCMESMFRTHGLPEILRSDNGPPFASREFEGFLEYLSIDHRKGIPYWPQSDGEVERLNKTLLKAIRIAQLQGKDWKREVQDFLFQYRSTPHTVTSLSPAELLMGRKLRDTLPQVKPSRDQATEAEWQILLRERYARSKLREKEYADSKRHATTSDIAEGDMILLRQNRENKLSPTFEPEPYRVVEKNGNAVIIENSSSQSKMRNAGHMKKFVDPGAETGASGTELPAPSETTDTPKEGASFEQDPMDGIQPDSQRQAVPSVVPERPESRPVRKRESPKWMKDFICQK